MANRLFGNSGIEMHPDASYQPASQQDSAQDSKSPYVLNAETSMDRENGHSEDHIHHHHGRKLMQLNSNVWRTIRSLSWFVHILALGCTAAAIQFSFSGFYWADEDDWGNVQMLKFLKGQQTQDALQFAAKLHEIIIQASLSAMVLHFLRRMLIGKGIAWGLMGGCYQVGAPLYLFSYELWANLLKPNKKQTWILAFTLMLLCFYSNTIGPFSAIVLSPILEWWPVSDPFNGRQMVSYIGSSFDGAYPAFMDEVLTLNEEPVCLQYGEAFCPDGGMDEVKAIIDSYALNHGRPQGEVRQQGVDVSRELVATNKYATEDEHMSLATTLHASVSELTAGFWNYLNATEVGKINGLGRPRLLPREDNVMAPIVQVQCSHYSFLEINDDGGDAPQWETSRLRNFSSYSAARPETDYYKKRQDWKVPNSFTDFWGNTTDLAQYWDPDRDADSRAYHTFTWVEAASVFQEEGPSLAALVTVPVTKDDNGLVQDSLILPCMIDAHWAGATTQYDPTADKLLPNNLTDVDALARYWEGDTPTSDVLNSRKAYVSSAWADYLNHEVRNMTSENFIGDDSYTGPAMEWLLLDFIQQVANDADTEALLSEFRTPDFKDGDDDSASGQTRGDVAKTVANVIALALAEGMARVAHRQSYGIILEDLGNGTSSTAELYLQSWGGAQEPTQMENEALDTYYKIEWKVERKGWGYGLRTPTVKAGIAVLLIHAALVVVYAAYVIVFHISAKGWHLTAWGSFGELIALGLASRRPENRELLGKLVSASDNWETMTTTMAVRSVDGQTLELVIGDDIQGNKLLREKAYSWL